MVVNVNWDKFPHVQNFVATSLVVTLLSQRFELALQATSINRCIPVQVVYILDISDLFTSTSSRSVLVYIIYIDNI